MTNLCYNIYVTCKFGYKPLHSFKGGIPMKKIIISAMCTGIAVAIANYILCVRPIKKDLYERYGAMQFLADMKRLQRYYKHEKVVRD